LIEGMKDKLQIIKNKLDEALLRYNSKGFVANDPITIPHRFSKKQDIEIAAFFAAIFAWGNRTTIIQKTSHLMELMEDAPYEFITQHQSNDLIPFLNFKHRTFQADDLFYFIHFLKVHYSHSNSLETAFIPQIWSSKQKTIEPALVHFKNYFFSLPEALDRTKKHISSPESNSACKRLNMFLRWMVRTSKDGIDFGIWTSISPKQLVCPLDVHVCRVAQQLGLLKTNKADWKAAFELTLELKKMDKEDPIKYDIALFSLGVNHIK